MTWFGFALLSAVLLTLVNFGDKFLVESQVRHPYAVVIFLSWINLGFAIILWTISGFPILPYDQAFLLFLAGMPTAFAGFFYFQAVSRAETSRVVILLQMGPVFTLILSMVFLGDSLSAWQLLGFAVTISAAIAVTALNAKQEEASTGSLDLSILWLLLATNLIYAAGIVLADNLVERLVVDIRTLIMTIAYTSFGYWLGGLALFFFVRPVRHAIMRNIPQNRFTAVGALAGVESIFLLRQFMVFAALSLGPVALVSVIGSLNVFFAVFLGWILTLWKPLIFKENISRENLLQKALWAGVAFIGIILMR